MTHNLNIDISDTLSAATLRVSDSSIYIPNASITNGILEITTPYLDCPILFNVVKEFNLILNGNNMGIPCPSGQTVYLPDGIYKMKYSINPNVSSFVMVNWLRTSKIETLYREKVRELFSKRDNIGHSNFDILAKQLINVNFEINAAKSFAHDDCDFKKSSFLYNSAKYTLQNFKGCIKC